MQQVGDLLQYSRQWVADQLRQYALESASGGGAVPRPLEPTDGHRDLSHQVSAVVTLLELFRIASESYGVALSIHDNYTDYYPGSPGYDPDLRVMSYPQASLGLPLSL